MGLFDAFLKRKMAKEITCPACHNDNELKKKCIVCRGKGKVWKQK